MARKVKFPLDLKDGYQARSNIEEVRTYFDIEKIIAQFHNGKLKIWLEDHYLPAEAEQVGALDGNAPDLAQRLCTILGVTDVPTENVDTKTVQTIQRREERRHRLSQYTTNPILCDRAEFAAFDQADLERLVKEGAQEIILCNASFRIPLNVKNKTYLGVGKAVAVIESKTALDFSSLGIHFVDLPFDEAYQKAMLDEPRKYFEQGQAYEAKGKNKKAIECYQKALEFGYADAVVPLAEIYKKQGKEEEMLRILTEAGEQGNVKAMGALYWYYDENEDVFNHAKWAERAALQGDTTAMRLIADCYIAENGVEEDAEKAFHWYQKSAQAGDSDGMCHFADCYRDGRGCEQNLSLAVEWYEKSAELENPFAMCRLGLLYDAGKGVPHDVSIAAQWYQKSAEAGNGYAMYYLAMDYEYGEGVAQSEVKAKEWYEKAAYKQIPEAECRLGEYCFDEGNYAKARFWYKRAADRGNGEALNMQGILRSSEEYGLHNDRKAVEYYWKSAEAGYGWGMYNLASCCEEGRGIAKDLELALEWYVKAADEGIEDAKKWLREHIMTPAVMAELCSTLILGRLKSGEFLWEMKRGGGNRWCKNSFTYQINPNIKSTEEWIRKGIVKRKEIIIGGTKSASNEEIIFTNLGVYTLGRSENAYWTPYVAISGVQFINRGAMSFQICLANGDKTHLENAGEWYDAIDLANVRLFLLLVAHFIGQSTYEFIEAELQKLRLVTLASLENHSIADYL